MYYEISICPDCGTWMYSIYNEDHELTYASCGYATASEATKNADIDLATPRTEEA